MSGYLLFCVVSLQMPRYIYSDCQVVAVNSLGFHEQNIDKYTSMVYHRRKLLKQISEVRIEYCNRVFNCMTNVMASIVGRHIVV